MLLLQLASAPQCLETQAIEGIEVIEDASQLKQVRNASQTSYRSLAHSSHFKDSETERLQNDWSQIVALLVAFLTTFLIAFF